MVQSGGVPLQQVLAAKLVESGTYLRRERSYEGVEIGARVAPVNTAIAENISSIMSRIMEFDELKKSAVKGIDTELKREGKSISRDGSTGSAGATSTNFTSLMHNVIGQTLLALKAEATVQEALQSLRNGEKPVITLANTMGSTIGSAAEDQGLQAGDPIDLSVGDLLKRYLIRSRDVTEKSPFGEVVRRPLTDEELSLEAIESYEMTMELIDEIDWSGIPISPIDYIHYRLQEEGYTSNEITGRTDRVEYTAGGGQNYQTRTTKEKTNSAAIGYVNAFNSGDLDVIILNRSGSTGLSLHASERFADQRPRRMIVAQPELDINQFMQMLGRVHRTGQVEKPRYTILMGDLPAEKRPAAVLMKKMASLNANTTAARDNGFTMENVVDFMNDYGDQVACEVLAGNPGLNKKLGCPISGIESDMNSETDVERLDTQGAINKVTGRIPLLPIAEQEKVYALITQEYAELVERERAMGNSILEAETLDLEARTLARMEAMPKKQDTQSVFGAAVYLEVIDAKSHRKSASQIEVVNAVRQEVGMISIKDLAEHDPEMMMRFSRYESTQTLQDLNAKVAAYKESGIQSARRVFADYPEGEVPGDILAKVAERIQKFEAKTDRQALHVNNVLARLIPGETVRLVNEKDGTVFYGVVEKFIDKTNVNPVMPSNWKVQIQVADSARQITLPLSKVNTSSTSGMRIELSRTDVMGRDVYQLFDDRSTSNREQRQVFTGNVIRAFEKFKGKLINYTDAQGGIQQGLMMARGFDIRVELDKQPVRIPTVLDAERFMFEVSRGTGQLKTADESLTVRPMRDGGVQLITEKSRSEGGHYYMDAGFIEASNGGEFYSSGSLMTKRVEPEDVTRTLDYIYENYGGLYAFDGRDKARDMLQLDLPEFENTPEQQGAILEAIADLQSQQEISQPPVVGEVTQDVRKSLESLFDGGQNEPVAQEQPEAQVEEQSESPLIGQIKDIWEEASAEPATPSELAVFFLAEAGIEDLSEVKDFTLILEPDGKGDRLSVALVTLEFRGFRGAPPEIEQILEFESLGEQEETFKFRTDQDFRLLNVQQIGVDRIAELLQSWIENGYPQELKQELEQRDILLETYPLEKIQGDSIVDAVEPELTQEVPTVAAEPTIVSEAVEVKPLVEVQESPTVVAEESVSEKPVKTVQSSTEAEQVPTVAVESAIDIESIETERTESVVQEPTVIVPEEPVIVPPTETVQSPVELAHDLLEQAVVQSVADGVPIAESIQQVVQEYAAPDFGTEPEAVISDVEEPTVGEPDDLTVSAEIALDPVDAKPSSNVVPMFLSVEIPQPVVDSQSASTPLVHGVEPVLQNEPLQEFGVSVMELTRQVLERHDPGTIQALEKITEQSTRYSPSLGEMREWMDVAKSLNKEHVYTKRIAQLAGQMLDGTDEIFKPVAERDAMFRNADFTLSEAASKALHQDITVSRNQQVAAMAKDILGALGKQDGQGNVVFERPNGNYSLSLNSATNDLTISSKAQGGNVILQETNGQIDHGSSSVTATDLNTFKAFSAQVKTVQATTAKVSKPIKKQAVVR
jgi:hypothetical protein